MAETASFTPADGWNTQNVITPVSLTAGNYWLAYLPSSNALSFVKQNASGSCYYYYHSFGSGFPTTFNTKPNNCTPTTWSFYATLAPSGVTAVNGVCGASNGADLTSAPITNLCSAGTAGAVAGSGPWTWSCGGSNGGTTAMCQALAGGLLPVLVQHVASTANPVGLGIPGNNYNIPLPNPVLAGDALVLGITYPHGEAIKISDTLGQPWPAAAITEDGGDGNYATAIYVLCGSAGGNETLKVGLTSSSIPFEYTVSEFSNVAPTGCVDGAVGGANLSPNASALISPGSFTPATDNDANGGHIIWNYNAISGIANGNPTSWIPATNFTLLDGDIAWTNKQGFPHASQWSIQTTNGPVIPSITATGDTADTFNSASVSLLVDNVGGTLPSGIHINKIIHESWVAPSSNATLKLQLPTTGNLRVLAFPVGQNNIDITSITDSDGGIWNLEQTGEDSAQIWYAANTQANPNLIVSIHTSGTSPTNSARFFDIRGAAAAPFDVAAGTDLTDCSSVATINDQPIITPTGANELVIATMGIGNGPGLGLASGSPAGVWDLTTYTHEVDTDLMENADALAHFYNTTTLTEHWNWHITPNGNNSCSSEAVAFK